jgi:multidrug efflux pump subunit AcrA (membrane-fusion protein)
MRLIAVVFGLLTCLAIVRPVRAADTVTLPNCVLSLDAQAEIPAQEPGVLTSIPVREGQSVVTDQLLAQIDDLIPRMRYEVAKNKLEVSQKQAEDDIDIRYARKAAAVAQAIYEGSVKSNQTVTGAVADADVKQQKLEWEKFLLSIEKAQKDFEVARLQVKVSEAELQAANADVEHRRLVAPLDGVVVELMRHQGEWVQAGETVMRIVRVDVLRVEGRLNIKDYQPSEIRDRSVSIVIKLPGDKRATVPGRIVYVSPLVATGGYFDVRAEIKNRQEDGVWVLSPGMSAEMTIQLK